LKIFDKDLMHLTRAEYEKRQEEYRNSSDYQYFLNLQHILDEITEEIRVKIAKNNAKWKIFKERLKFLVHSELKL